MTLKQINAARGWGYALAGCNKVWEIVPDLQVLYGCNLGFWQEYWSPTLANYPASKWTTNAVAATNYGIHWVAEVNRSGLSQNPAFIHHGHGSGYSLVNLVYLMGAARIVLLGYDLKYAPDYDGKGHHIGSQPRHYFGEYPSKLQHWPSVHVHRGVHTELLNLYRSIADQDVVEVINATPGSAIDCFPTMDL